MEKRKRPCLVISTRWNAEKGKQEELNFNGLFHEWGNEAVETNQAGFGNFTVGIVEDNLGQIHTINPNHIRFMDRN